MKVLLVGGKLEEKEMDKISIGLGEANFSVVTHQFEEDKTAGQHAEDLGKRIQSEQPTIVFTRKNFFPNPHQTTQYVTEYILGLNVPIIGSGTEAIKTLRNKSRCDIQLLEDGLPYANDFILFDPTELGRRPYGKVINRRGFSEEDLVNPFQRHSVLFMKPNSTGRSTGISDANVVRTMDELVARSKELGEEVGKSIILTPFYAGKEYTIGMVGNTNPVILPVEVCQVEGYSKNGILPEGVKRGGIPSGRVFIRKIEDSDLFTRLQKAGVSIFNSLGVNDYTRMDFRKDGQEKLHVIDVNGVPGIKYKESYLSIAAEEAFGGQENGCSVYARLLSSIVCSSARRFGLDVDENKHPTLFGLENKLMQFS